MQPSTASAMTPQRAFQLLITSCAILTPQLKSELLTRLPSLTPDQIQAVGYFLTLGHRRSANPVELAAQIHQLLEHSGRTGRHRTLPQQHVVR